jgi:hypothetical protein
MNRRPPEWQPFARCIWVRAYLLHLLPARIRRVLRPLRR